MVERRRILVVDDSIDAAQVLAMLLEGMGHEVRLAHEGASAIRLAAQHPPDCILLDLRLPDMSGYEVVKALRAQAALSSTVIVALSGFGGAEHREHCLAAGFNAYYEKPIDLPALEGLLGGRA